MKSSVWLQEGGCDGRRPSSSGSDVGFSARLLSFVAVVSVLWAGGSRIANGDDSNAGKIAGIGSEVMPALQATVLPAPYVPPSGTIRLALPPLSPDERHEQERMQSGDGPLRLGLGRTLRSHQQVLSALERRPWSPTAAGGHALEWHLTSPGAVGLRLAVRPGQVPDGMLLRVSAPGQGFVPPISGAEIKASVRHNREAGGDDEAAGLFWLPLVVSDTLVLQVELPAGVQPEDASLELVRVSHFFSLPFLEDSAQPPAAPDEGTDSACAEQWDASSRATTLLLYTHSNGATGACTGTLLNDADPQTFIPYVLTAHHCFPDQVRASSIESLWFVRSETCGGALASYATVSGGADVLYLAKSTDTALLRLRHPPPPGAVFSGSAPALPATGDEVFGVHHPAAQRQQRTVAVVSEYMNCEQVDYCGDHYYSDDVHFVRVDRRLGGTSGGSSGSGLYNTAQRLIGQHLGGSDAGAFDYYGRFDQPYRDGLVWWLGSDGSAH